MSTALRDRIDLGDWNEVLAEQFDREYMENLSQFVRVERKRVEVYPPPSLVFNAFMQTPLEKIKVVIMGQDPYHGPGQAHGLSFSVPRGEAPPPSLQNIFKEIESDLGILPPQHGCLVGWAKQGVLLLNATLTVRRGEPKSHYGRGWEQFTDAVIEALMGRSVIFVLWGSSAREKVERVIHLSGERPGVLTAPHPSPFSVHRGFFGCRHFSKVNELLIAKGEQPIDWSL